MLRVLLSQGRRFGAFSLGMAFFTTALLMRFGSSWADLEHLLFFLLCLVGYLFIGIGLFTARPRQRGILEIAGFAGFITTIVLAYFPYMGLFPSLFGLTIFTGIMMGTWLFMGTKLSQSLGKNKTWRDNNAFLAPYSARRAWRHIVPGECEPSENCTGTMLSIEAGLNDKDNMRVIFGTQKHWSSVYDLTFLEKKAPNVCRFYFQGHERSGILVDGVFAVNIEPIERDSCYITSTEERSGLSLGGLIERWFDNPLYFQHIKLLQKLEEVYGEPGTPPKS